MTTSIAPSTERTSETIRATIEERRARLAKLTEQLQKERDALERHRAGRSRALAEGRKWTETKPVAERVEEVATLEGAVALLDSELATLEQEQRGMRVDETEALVVAALAHASAAADELDATLRSTIQETLLPLADRLTMALREARHAERLQRQAAREHGLTVNEVQDRADDVVKRRGEMMELVRVLRAYGANERRAHGVTVARNAGEGVAA